ncbi:MAG: preprotein translocase subunit YajC, partial [Planctomycetota bacterium]
SGTTAGGAAEPAKGPGKTRQPSPFDNVACFFLPAILLLMYFMMIRPQQKQEKARRQMLAELKKGDHVVTGGGIHCQVVSIGEATVTVKFGSDPGQRFKIDRSGINRVLPKGESGEGAS